MSYSLRQSIETDPTDNLICQSIETDQTDNVMSDTTNPRQSAYPDTSRSLHATAKRARATITPDPHSNKRVKVSQKSNVTQPRRGNTTTRVRRQSRRPARRRPVSSLDDVEGYNILPTSVKKTLVLKHLDDLEAEMDSQLANMQPFPPLQKANCIRKERRRARDMTQEYLREGISIIYVALKMFALLPIQQGYLLDLCTRYELASMRCLRYNDIESLSAVEEGEESFETVWNKLTTAEEWARYGELDEEAQTREMNDFRRECLRRQ